MTPTFIKNSQYFSRYAKSNIADDLIFVYWKSGLAPSGMCTYGERNPSLRRIIEMHLHAPSLIHSVLNSLSQIASCSHWLLVQAKTYPDDSLLSCRFVLSPLTSCDPFRWLVSYSVEVWDREFSTEWIREGACKCISLMLLRDGLCSPYAHIPLGAHPDFHFYFSYKK